ncbi:MAG: DUF4369 domain-containing protein [Flavobacteriaceae bacterium]|nr:DUF4369 domain-containing protein [Flavobacteriaceae bacterium]
MKNYLLTLLIGIALVSCESESANEMIVSGEIAGLKKGTLYLQHIQDSVLTTIDSLVIAGNGSFRFKTEVPSPELFYLYLKKADNNDLNDRISFFGEAGEISINTHWNTFDLNAEVSGSTSNDVLEECRTMLTNFNKRDLELAQLAVLPEFQEVPERVDSIQKLMDRNIIRRYQYVLNFALRNGNTPVAPYLALSEVADANPKYLDSIRNNLSASAADSKYGKALAAYLDQ